MCSRVVVLLAVALLAACADDVRVTVSEGKIQPTAGPYIVTAIDNHFHDVHPEEDVEIAGDRRLVVKNEGRNLHNFTIAGTDISKDLRPGRSFRLGPLADVLGPGTYSIICRYHDAQGMTGELTVTE